MRTYRDKSVEKSLTPIRHEMALIRKEHNTNVRKPQHFKPYPHPYPWGELFYKWEHAQITTEQLGGQLLVRSQQLHEMLTVCQRELEGINQAVADLDARVQELKAALFEERLYSNQNETQSFSTEHTESTA